MQSLPSSGIEPEPALQAVIWRKSGDHEGQNMADNNRCGIMDTFSPHIKRDLRDYPASCGLKTLLPF